MLRHLKWLGAIALWSVLASVQAEPDALGLEALPELQKMQDAGVLLLDSQRQPVVAKSEDTLFVPASTTKLLTAFLALSHWGEGHRFHTDFFVAPRADTEVPYGSDQKVRLYVKGYGDPFLVSEELQEVAKELQKRLQKRGIERLEGIVLDVDYFAESLVLPGTGSSDNPYDAVPSALAANFNTLFLKLSQGQLASAETQTPLTPLALELGKGLKTPSLRMNTGPDPKVGQRYFAELLSAFLRQQGVEVGESVEWQAVEKQWQPVYRHVNRMDLAEVIRPMMRYSTNFIANQLALILSAELYGPPATEQKVAQMFAHQLAHYFDWQGARIEEGAGLSRANRLSPVQLAELLERFRPWKHLLPEVVTQVYAKSGSLMGVSTLAGYIEHEADWLPFVLMINQQVPFYQYRNQVATALKERIERHSQADSLK
jgi:D-alanyl-D-alanine carboxypeptidase/D-alanyl-D-alanine-endopeptidase (penicillin-binding protein 4)